MDPAALRSAAKSVPEVESHIHAGSKAFPPETDQAAGALGSGWATASVMKQLSSDWLQALKRLADEVDHLGGAVEKSAESRKWAEEKAKQRITQIRTGAR